MTAAARRGHVNFFVEYGEKTKTCRVTETALNKARVSKRRHWLRTVHRDCARHRCRQHRANIRESLLWISSADGRSSIFASLTSTSCVYRKPYPS
jgi:ribosomal protein L16/L10AE